MIKIVTVFGTGTAKPGDKYFILAEQLGKLLAEASFAIANGGYGGTMLASAKGANQAGGEVIGITNPRTKKDIANKFISREIVTTSLAERLEKLVEIGSAYIILGGGTGTLLELAMVWEMKNKGFLNEDKPIILLGDYWQRLVETIAADDPESRRHLLFAREPKDVIEILKKKR